MAKKKLQGTVISIRDEKTAVVSMTSVKVHPRYKKRFKVTKKYLAHIDQLTPQINDEVLISETRPYSKRKSWLVEMIVKGGE